MTQEAGSIAEELAGIGIRPIRTQVVVRQDKPKDKLASGLYLPDVCARELQEDFGLVLGVGPKVASVIAGERVMFQRRAGTALVPDPLEPHRPDWRDVLILDEEDLIAIVES